MVTIANIEFERKVSCYAVRLLWLEEQARSVQGHHHRSINVSSSLHILVLCFTNKMVARIILC